MSICPIECIHALILAFLSPTLKQITQEEDDNNLETKGFYPADARKLQEVRGCADSSRSFIPEKSISFCTELSIMLQREMRSLLRDKTLMIVNVTVTTCMALIFGLFFLGVGDLNRTDPAVSSGNTYLFLWWSSSEF
jgi:hypothetical protein